MAYFLASDDISLYFTGEPAVASKAAIVFLHGLGEHIGRYEAVFEDFSGQGYGCALVSISVGSDDQEVSGGMLIPFHSM